MRSDKGLKEVGFHVWDELVGPWVSSQLGKECTGNSPCAKFVKYGIAAAIKAGCTASGAVAECMAADVLLDEVTSKAEL